MSFQPVCDAAGWIGKLGNAVTALICMVIVFRKTT